jgi:hypothetical protein
MSRPATPAQINKLAEYGYPTPQNFDHARQLMDQLAASGWQQYGGAAPAPPQGAPFYPPAAPQQGYVPPTATPQYQAPNNTYPNGQTDRPPTGGQTGQRRDPNAPATPNQVKILNEKGYNTIGWTFAQASAVLDQLKRNNWQPLPGGPVAPPAVPAQQYPQGYQQPQQQYHQPQYAGAQGYAAPNQDPLPWGE